MSIPPISSHPPPFSDSSRKHKEDSSLPVPQPPLISSKELKQYRIEEVNLKQYRDAAASPSGQVMNIAELGISNVALWKQFSDEVQGVEKNLNGAKEAKEKIEILDKAIQNASLPEMAASYELEEGRQYLLMGNPGEALKHFREAQQFYPTQELTYLSAVAHAMQGQWTTAFALYEEMNQSGRTSSFWEPFQILFKPLVELLRNKGFAEQWAALPIEQKNHLLAFFSKTNVPDLSLQFNSIVEVLSKIRDQNTAFRVIQFYEHSLENSKGVLFLVHIKSVIGLTPPEHLDKCLNLALEIENSELAIINMAQLLLLSPTQIDKLLHASQFISHALEIFDSDVLAQFLESFEAIQKSGLSKVLFAMIKSESRIDFNEKARKLLALDPEILVHFLELAAAHPEEAEKLLTNPRFSQTRYAFRFINIQLTKLKNAHVHIHERFIDQCLAYQLPPLSSQKSISEIMFNLKLFAQFPNLHERLTKLLHSLPDSSRNYLSNALDLFSEADLEAYLDLQLLFPNEMADLLNEHILPSDQCYLFVPVFKNIADRLKILQRLRKENLAKVPANEQSIIIQLFNNQVEEIRASLERAKAYFTLPLSQRTGGLIDSQVSGLLAYTSSPSLFSQFVRSDRIPPPAKSLSFSEINFLCTWAQNKPKYLVEPFMELFISIFNSEEFIKNYDLNFLTNILESSDYLVSLFPHLTPKFFHLIRNDPKLLIQLFSLNEVVFPDVFQYIVERYIANRWVGDKYTSELVSEQIARWVKAMNNVETRDQFHKLTQCERLVGNPLLINIKHLSKILSAQSPLIPTVLNNAALAKQLRFRHFLGPADWQNVKTVSLLYEVVGSNSKALDKIVNEQGIWDSHSPATPVSRVYQAICKLHVEPSNRPLIAALNVLVSADEAPLAERLLAIADLDLRNRLMHIVSSGELTLVKKLLELPDNALTQRLLTQVNIDSLPVVRGILHLLPDMPADMTKLLSLGNTPFTLYERTLLSLLAQGERTLLTQALGIVAKPAKEWSHEEQRFMSWITISETNGAGNYCLAKSYLDQHGDPFWKAIASSPLDTATTQSLRDLQVNLMLMAQPPHSWPMERISLIMQRVLNNAQTTPALARLWIGSILLLVQQNPEYLSKLFSSTLSDIKIRQLLLKETSSTIEKSLKSSNSSTVAKTIADLLVTPTGCINQPLIELFNQSILPDENSLSAQHLKHILMILSTDHSFSDRLEHLTLPPTGRRQALVRSILNMPERQLLTRRDAQVAALSALFYPLRQSAACSCFATAIAIQGDSSPEGLKQGFEDFLSLIQHGSLRRRAESGQVEHAMAYEPEVYRKLFSQDHPLVRVREFTLASSSSPDPTFFRQTRTHLHHLLSDATEAFKKSLNSVQAKAFMAIEPLIKAQLIAIGNDLSAKYLGYAQFSGEPQLGAWVIVDPLTKTPLILSRVVFEGFFQRTLQTHALLLRDPEQANMAKLFDESVASYLRSDKFLTDFFQVDNVKAVPFGLNLAALPKTPLTIFRGGYVDRVVETSQPGVVVRRNDFPTSRNPLESVFTYIQNLPESEKAAARRNPFLLKTVVTPTHTMNLKLGALLAMIEKAGGPSALVQNITRAGQLFLQTAVTPALKKSLIDHYFKELKVPALLRKQFKQELEAFVPAPKTVGQLCQLIYVQSAKMLFQVPHATEKITYALQFALRQNKELRERMPDIFNLFDTNWNHPDSIVIGLNFTNGNNELFFAQNNVPRFNQVVVMHPLILSEICTLEFSSRTDEFCRAYCGHLA